jgi:undecaprenyl-diphosphatase
MLQQIDLDVLYFFNVTLSSSLLDVVMPFLTNSRNWMPVYALAAIFLVWKHKWRGVLIVCAVAIMVGAANTITNVVVKEFIERPRPCATDAVGAHIISWIRLPDGMRFGFSMPSSHAVNNFATAMFFFILFPSRKIFLWLFFTAGIVASTRLYLGLHYPTDTLAGALLGIGLGYVLAKGYLLLEKKYFRTDESLLP